MLGVLLEKGHLLFNDGLDRPRLDVETVEGLVGIRYSRPQANAMFNGAIYTSNLSGTTLSSLPVRFAGSQDQRGMDSADTPPRMGRCNQIERDFLT